MTMKMFSDRRFLSPPSFLCHMLLPFWNHEKEHGDPDADRFDKYIAAGRGIFQMVSLEEADLAVYPASPTHNLERFKEFQQITNSKPLVVFFNDDSDIRLEYRPNTYVFRTSFYKSSQRPTEFGLAAWTMDYGAFPERLWKPRPTVGFCGQIYPLDTRQAALLELEHHPTIDTRFVRRPQFFGGWISSGRRKEIGELVRREYLENTTQSDYILCARGGGNFSYRLYETMMCGRIPLLVNTDCVLPYDFLVEWGKLFPIVDKVDITHIGNRLMEYHQSMTPEQFAQRQRDLRHMWEEWLSPVGFFSNFHKHFQGENK